MMQRMKGTLRPGRKAGVLALAVLLLTCVLMAGAVSAEDTVYVSNSQELQDNITTGGATTIILKGSFATDSKINVTRDVTIGGDWNSLSAGPNFSDVYGHLINIDGDHKVVLENITLNSNDKAKGAQAYLKEDTAAEIRFKNVVLMNSKGSGLTVNGANVSLVNVTVKNSAWQSVDVGKGKDVNSAATLTIDKKTELLDDVQINVDNPRTAEATVNPPDGTPYKPYSFFYNDEGYGEKKLVWSTKVDEAAQKIAESKKVTFNATVQNTGDDPLAYHADFSKAMNAAEDGATVTQLRDINVNAPITIKKAITFDGKDKTIIGSSSEKYFLMVAVPLEGNADNSVTLQNLNLSISSIGTYANLGGITVRANADNDASVPVILKDSTVDMSGVTEVSGMNPAVYFVNASGSEITGNTITAGYTDSSSTRCVVVDGGSDVTISNGNTLNLGTADEGAVSIGVQIKGSNPKDVIVTGNTITAPNDPNTKSIAVDITTTGKAESHSITGNIISAAGSGKFDSAVRVLLSSAISDDGGSLGITVSGNTVTDAKNGVYIMAGSPGAQEKQLTLTGTINVDDFQELSQDTILAADSTLTNPPITDSVKWTHDPEPSYSSSSGNMNNAYRVLFNDGSTTLSVQTDLSSGDKLTKPETPVKDGYTFAGWYKDSACTQGWDFETGISGDMTLYAKWTAAGSSGETEATTAPTATSTAVTTPQPTKTQSTTATTSAPEATTAAGVSPTLTQAPAPVAGALFGLLAAGVLLRRRFQ